MATVLRMFSGMRFNCSKCGEKATTIYKGKYYCKDHKTSETINLLKALLSRVIQSSI